MSQEQPYPRPFGIRQLITATNNWTGAAPGTVAVFSSDVLAYPTSTVGGLFDPHADVVYKNMGGATLKLIEFLLVMDGNQGVNWSIKKITSGGQKILLQGPQDAVGGETDVVLVQSDTLRFLPGEKIEVITAGCTGAMWAQATFKPEEVL